MGMSLSGNYFVLETISAIDCSESTEDVIRLFMEYASQQGFSSFLIAQVINPLRPNADKAMLYTNWPDELIETRFAKNQIIHDPIIQYGLKSKYAFSWDDAYEHASRFGRRMMDTARDHRIAKGFSFPMRRPGAPIGGISLGGENIGMSSAELGSLELVSMHAYSRLEALHTPFPVEEIKNLSTQETEALYLTAVGKTAWETGGAMGISEAAVKDALRRVREKLGVMNTLHACTTAISRDLILP